MKQNFIVKFIKLESAGGIILVAAALLAILLANSPGQTIYNQIFNSSIVFAWSHWQLPITCKHIINEGLMAIFFLMVSLEIKRELLVGELNTRAKAILPCIAAFGGMLMPALIYVVLNLNHTANLRGWAIPAATDIAFSLGILTLLGARIPFSLKIFLTALAILDDLAAIIIIAVFYTDHLAVIYLSLAALCILALIGLNRLGVERIWPYVLIGVILWFCTLQSGVHATVAGVTLGLTIPLRAKKQAYSPLRQLEKKLHPWVTFAILPLFALANAGLSFTDINKTTLLNPLPLAIAAGLFLGKQMGVLSFSWLAIKTGIARMPAKVNWHQFYGVALLCGIGFTMSLFIGTLAFPDTDASYSELVRLGVLAGSLLSGIFGYIILRLSKK